MADKPNILSEFSVLAKPQKILRPVRLAAQVCDVEVEIEAFDVERVHPIQIAAAAMKRRPIGLAATLSRAIRRERGARSEKAVYVIGAESDEIAKIGVAWHPDHRLTEIQTSHWERLHLAALFWVYGDEFEIEAKALRLATEEGHRLSGEWVGVSPDRAAMYVAEVVSQSSTPVCDSAMWVRNRARARDAAKQADWFYANNPDASLKYMRQDWDARLASKF